MAKQGRYDGDEKRSDELEQLRSPLIFNQLVPKKHCKGFHYISGDKSKVKISCEEESISLLTKNQLTTISDLEMESWSALRRVFVEQRRCTGNGYVKIGITRGVYLIYRTEYVSGGVRAGKLNHFNTHTHTCQNSGYKFG